MHVHVNYCIPFVTVAAINGSNVCFLRVIISDVFPQATSMTICFAIKFTCCRTKESIFLVSERFTFFLGSGVSGNAFKDGVDENGPIDNTQ